MGPHGHLLYLWWNVEGLILASGPWVHGCNGNPILGWQHLMTLSPSSDFYILSALSSMMFFVLPKGRGCANLPLKARCLLLNNNRSQKSCWSWGVSRLASVHGGRKVYADYWEKASVVSLSCRPCLLQCQPSQQDTLNGTTMLGTATAFGWDMGPAPRRKYTSGTINQKSLAGKVMSPRMNTLPWLA